MFFKKIPHKILGFAVMGFAAGTLLAFVLPPVVIAIVECILLVILCWCCFCM